MGTSAPAVALAVATALATGAAVEQHVSVQNAAFPSGTRVAGSGAGEILTWEPHGTLTRWDSAGRRLGAVSTAGLVPQDGAPLAARGQRALLCAREGGGVRCRVLASSSGRLLGSFSWDQHPARAWPAA